jgi:heptosyltransferase-2
MAGVVMTGPPARLVVVSPNWLGDAVMALPVIADLHRAWGSTRVTIAARAPVAPLYAMVDGVTDVLVLKGGGGLAALHSVGANVELLRQGRFDAALLLPNSFLSAWTASRAGIHERWGFRADGRGRLLTRAITRPAKQVHQAQYYQALGEGLGVAAGPRAARITVAAPARAQARSLLHAQGLPDASPFVALAPGAAYGRAKQWLPARFAELAALLFEERGLRAVVVGTRGDAAVCREIASAASGVVDLCGRTDLATLAGVLAAAHAVVANDSGAMHLAAASGARVVAVFGATNENRTAPLGSGADTPPATIVTTDVWCRPCMLRECPIDHRCMTRITARDVLRHI